MHRYSDLPSARSAEPFFATVRRALDNARLPADLGALPEVVADNRLGA
jgi:hypothetical protein